MVAMHRSLALLPLIFAARVLFAFEFGAYVPHYRLGLTPGAENSLGRASWDPSPHPWDGRLAADRAPRALPGHWSEGSWSRRLGGTFGTLYLHIPLDADFLDGNAPDPRQVSFLRSVVGEGNTRIFLSLIGTSSEYMPLAEEESARRELAEVIASVCEASDMDGFDLDWEFSSAPRSAEREVIKALAEELRGALPRGTVLSAAVSRWRLPEKGFFEAVDEVHLMAYDGGGRHATYESAVADAEAVLARTKIPPNKILLGLPFYGRDYRPDSPEYWIKAKSYAEIADEFDPLGTDDEAGGFAFNGPGTIGRKTDWAAEKGLGGVFVWEPFQDAKGAGSLSEALRAARIEN